MYVEFYFYCLRLNSDVYQSSLNIEKRSLNAGVYIAKLNVILHGVGLDNKDEIYLIILEDAMKAVIAGGSLQQLPWNQGFVLDASESVDPNEETQSHLEFEWFCEVTHNDQLRDCFGNGEGQIEFLGSKWRINEKILLEGVTYTFTVIVWNRKKQRMAEGKQKLILVDAEIPIVSIR